ncbi:MAG: ABC transporter permease [Rubellimicrobium sp.]|nr:ABC transporter permease [Rubellimicrobium sp.]
MQALLPVLVVWLALWALNVQLTAGSGHRQAWVRLAVPLIFGAGVLIVWQMVVRTLDVPRVILPAPTDIAAAFFGNLPMMWADFVQTIVKGAFSGLLIGTAAALVTAILVDRFPGLGRGLLPVASFMAALPIVGTAPIFVMWYGFGWESKAAVVVVMVFFPMLVNIVAGLKDTTQMQRDQMRTWAAGYWQTLLRLRLPAALPFFFNGLKIASTLAMIGAIVAEFFGSPTEGVGFRISASNGRLQLDMVWSAILVGALAGSVTYGLIVWIERRLTFWHPSQRG